MYISNSIPTKETNLFLLFFPLLRVILGFFHESLQLSSSSPAWASLFAGMRLQEWLCAWTQPQLEACFPCYCWRNSNLQVLGGAIFVKLSTVFLYWG